MTKLLQVVSILMFVVFSVLQVNAKNLIKNSSFEVGLEGYGLTRGVLEKGQKELKFIPLAIDNKEKYHGNFSLRIDNPDIDRISIKTREFKLESGKSYTFSFWAKASIPNVTLVMLFASVENYGQPLFWDFTPTQISISNKLVLQIGK